MGAEQVELAGEGGSVGTAYEDIPKPKSVLDMLRERAEGDHRPHR